MSFFLFIFISVSSQQHVQTDSKEIFTNEFFSNKCVHYILKDYLKKDKITIFDKDSLITDKPLNYSNARMTLAIDNKLSNADLFVQYYILNPDLAYVSLWGVLAPSLSLSLRKEENGFSLITVSEKLDKWFSLLSHDCIVQEIIKRCEKALEEVPIWDYNMGFDTTNVVDLNNALKSDIEFAVTTALGMTDVVGNT